MRTVVEGGGERWRLETGSRVVSRVENSNTQNSREETNTESVRKRLYTQKSLGNDEGGGLHHTNHDARGQ